MANPSSKWDFVPVWGVYLRIDNLPSAGTVQFTLAQRITRVDGRLIYPDGAAVSAIIGNTSQQDATVRAAVRAAWRAADETAAGVDFDGAAWDVWWDTIIVPAAIFTSFPASDDPDIVQRGYSVTVREQLQSGGGKTYSIQPVTEHLDLPIPGINLGLIEVPPGSPSVPAPMYAKGVPGGVAALNLAGQVINAAGEVIAPGGDYATAAQGAKADSAVQPDGLTKAAVGLGSVDNTADAEKPVSSAQSTALAARVRTDTAAQGLDSTQRANARTNIGLGGSTAAAALGFSPAGALTATDVQAAIEQAAALGGGAGGPGGNVVTHKVVAAAGATAAQKAAADYVCDGVNDEVQINAAIAAVAALYGAMSNSSGNAGCVQLVGTNFVIGNGCNNNTGSIKLRKNVTLRGAGMYKTWIKAANNFVTYTPSLVPDTNPVSGSGTAASNGAAGMIELADANVQYANIEDLLLFGNAAGGARVMGLRYDWSGGGTDTVLHSDTGCQASRVMVQQPASHGVYNVGSGANYPNRASQWSDIRVMDAGGTVDANAAGYWTSGADHVWFRCTTGSAAGHGWVISGANNHFTDCTSWFGGSLAATANGNTGNANGCGYYVAGGRHMFANCSAQDNFGHGFLVKSPGNTFASVIADSNGYSRVPGTATGSGFFLLAGENVIYGAAFDKAEGSRDVFQDYGVRFGDANLKGLIIDLSCNNNRLDSVGGWIPTTGNNIRVVDGGRTWDGGVAGRSIEWSAARQIASAPNTAPTDGDLANGQLSIWHDDTAAALKARIRTAAGTLRTVNLEGGGSADLSSVVAKDATLATRPTANQIRRTLGYSPETTDPDIMSIVVGSTQKMWLNEWGGLRGTSPYTWGDSLVRAVRSDGDGITAGQAIQVNDRRTGAPSPVMFGVNWADGSVVRNGTVLHMVYTLGVGEDESDLPANLPAGTLVLRRTA